MVETMLYRPRNNICMLISIFIMFEIFMERSALIANDPIRYPQIRAKSSIKVLKNYEIKMFCTTIGPRGLGNSLDTIPSFCVM